MSADLTKHNVAEYFERLTGLKPSWTDEGPNHLVFGISLDYLALTLNAHRQAVIEELGVEKLKAENEDMRDTLDRIHKLTRTEP